MWRVLGLVAMLAPLVTPTGAMAATVTVGRQAMSGATGFESCSAGSSSCGFMVAPTAVTSGSSPFASAPGDGAITAWRVRGSVPSGSGSFALRVLRPAGGGTYTVIASSSSTSTADGSAIPVSPAIPIKVGDHIGVVAVAISNGLDGEVRVDAAAASAAAYNRFPDTLDRYPVGATATPTSSVPNAEPLVNADVALDAPVVSAITPSSGSTGGGDTVTISGDHLAGTSAVRFGGIAATSFTVESNTQIAAVAPPSSAGTVDVIVTTLGGTSAPSSADRYTFVSPAPGPTPPAKASFAGSKSSISVDRKRRFRFSFRAPPGLKGSASFKSVKRVRVSSNKRVTLATKSFTVPGSGKVTLKVTLSKKNFRILKLNRKIRTRVTVRLKDAAGQTSDASKQITLKAP